MLIFPNSLNVDWSSFFRTLNISFNSNCSKILNHNRNKASKLFFSCNPHTINFHQLKILLVFGRYHYGAGQYELKIHRKNAITNVQVKLNSFLNPSFISGIFKGFIFRAKNLCSEK